MMNEDEKKLKQAYNNFAEQRELAGLEPWKFEERENFLQLLLREGRETFLEIGAGPGRDSLYFKENGLSVTSVDFSEEMVRLCKDKGLDAHCMDFRHLLFKSESFDAVFALNCLLHVPKAELDGVLRQIERILKPNGAFYYGVYGGQDTEGVWEQDAYEPKRFFAMYLDEDLVKLAERRFVVEDFHTVPMNAGTPHFQSLLLRKRP